MARYAVCEFVGSIWMLLIPLGVGTPCPRLTHVFPPSVDRNTVLTVVPETIPVLPTIIVEPSAPTENPLIDEVNHVDPSVVVIGSAFQLSPPLVERQRR